MNRPAEESGVHIDHVVLGAANRDLDRVVQAIDEHLGGLRAEFARLGVPTANLDQVLSAKYDLAHDLLPALRSRQGAAQRAATVPNSGFSMTDIADDPLSIGNESPSPAATSISFSAGGGRRDAQPKTVRFGGRSRNDDTGGDTGPIGDVAPVFGLDDLKDIPGDIKDGIEKGAKWLGEQISSAWNAMIDGLVEAWGEVVDWWEDLTARMGAWIDENLASVREWIKNNVFVVRLIGLVLKIVGWALVVIGAVLLIAAIIISLTGIGAVVGIPSASVCLLIIGAGFTLVSAGEFTDRLADWGEGKIDGQELIKGAALDIALGALSLVGVGIVGQVIKRILKHLPASWLKKLEDLFPKRKVDGESPKPVKGDVPGNGKPLKGGTVDDPVEYTFKHPSFKTLKYDPPTASELRRFTDSKKYEKWSREWTIAKYNEYRDKAKNPLSFEKWRERRVNGQWTNDARGKAYEREFWNRHGFDKNDGWENQLEGRPGVDTPLGERKFDIFDRKSKIGYELKSGNSIDAGELAKDSALKKDGWDVIYVFGKEPSPSVIKKLKDAGIPYEVWHGKPLGVPG